MTLRFRQWAFFVLWLVLVLCAPLTIFRTTPLDQIFGNSLILTNFFQRLTGLMALTLIFIQICLGSRMDWFVKMIGGKAYKIHITQGLITYGFMFIHPLLQNVIVYQASQSLTKALLVFMPSFAAQRDLLLVFGRVAFVLATIAVIAAYFRTKPFFRRNWRAFHILNYLVFYLILIHARGGSDIATIPFSAVYWVAAITVSLIVVRKILVFVIKPLPATGKEVEESSER